MYSIILLFISYRKMSWKNIILKNNTPVISKLEIKKPQTTVIEKREIVSFHDEFDLKYGNEMIHIKTDFEQFCQHMGIPFRLHPSFFDFIKYNTQEGVSLKQNVDRTNYYHDKYHMDENNHTTEEETNIPIKEKSFTTL